MHKNVHRRVKIRLCRSRTSTDFCYKVLATKPTATKTSSFSYLLTCIHELNVGNSLRFVYTALEFIGCFFVVDIRKNKHICSMKCFILIF